MYSNICDKDIIKDKRIRIKEGKTKTKDQTRKRVYYLNIEELKINIELMQNRRSLENIQDHLIKLSGITVNENEE